MDGKWVVNSSEDLYENSWGRVEKLDVTSPAGKKVQDRLAFRPKSTGNARTVAQVDDKGTLLLWCHRLITDTWTWMLPGGGIEGRELPHEAAEREMVEETGWKPGKLEKLIELQPLSSLAEQPTHIFFAREATWIGPGRDSETAGDIAWLRADDLSKAIDKGDISDAVTLAAVLYAMSKQLLS